jgi:hypothetical protein
MSDVCVCCRLQSCSRACCTMLTASHAATSSATCQLPQQAQRQKHADVGLGTLPHNHRALQPDSSWARQLCMLAIAWHLIQSTTTGNHVVVNTAQVLPVLLQQTDMDS